MPREIDVRTLVDSRHLNMPTNTPYVVAIVPRSTGPFAVLFCTVSHSASSTSASYEYDAKHPQGGQLKTRAPGGG
jgi:hypothetical protein